jgi:spore coat protein U-like protein
MNPFPRRWLALLLLLLGVALWPTGNARADDVMCQASVPGGISFGTVDPNQSGNTDTQASLDYSCTNSATKNYNITLCLNIGYGPNGLAASGNRQMAGAAGNLEFQLYRDSARTQPWGSIDTPAWSPVSVSFSIKGQTTVRNPTPLTIYARLPGGQTGVLAGAYSTTFSPGQLKITGYTNNSGDCTGVGSDVNNFSSFTVGANVKQACTVTALPLDFGTLNGFLNANLDATTTVSVTCLSGTAYQIGLDNGSNALGTTRRMAGGTAEYITYELYRDSGRTTRWGNSPLVDTMNSTGNGVAQTYTVYGRAAPQSTPSPGSYQDTITVSVYY